MIRPIARPHVLAAFAALVLVSACAGPPVDAQPVPDGHVYRSTSAPVPMSVSDIVLQLESGRAEEDITAELYDRGLAAPASASDLTLLRRAGASPALLQAIYEAPLATGEGSTSVTIIREPAFIPFVIDPWPYYYPAYRPWPAPRPAYRPHVHRPHPPALSGRPPPRPGVHPERPRPPTPNRFGPTHPRTPGMRPEGARRPAPGPRPPAGRGTPHGRQGR